MHLIAGINNLALTLLIALSLNAFVACENQIQQAQEQTNADLLENVHKLKSAAEVSKKGDDWNTVIEYTVNIYDLYKKIHHDDPNHIDLANCLSELGEAYSKTEKYQEALDSYLKSLGIMRNVFKGKPYKSEMATVLIELGSIYSKLDNNSEAVKYFLEALDITREVDQPNSKKIADILSNLGKAYGNLEDYPNAIKYTTEAFEVFITRNGDESNYSDMIYCLTKLIHYLRVLKQYERALGYAKTWNKLLKQTVSQNDLVAFSYYNLGYLYYHLGNYENAVKNLEIAHSIYSRIKLDLSNRNHMAEVCYFLGWGYLKTLNLSPSIRLLMDALERYRDLDNESPDNKGPEIVSTLEALGTAHVYSRNRKRGEIYFLEALDLYQHLDLNLRNKIDIHSLYTRLGLYYFYEGGPEKAVEYLTLAFNYYEKSGQDENAEAIIPRLVSVLIDIEDYPNAKKYASKALKLHKKINNDPNHPKIAKAHESLAKIYSETGKQEKALEHQRKAADMCSKFNFNEQHKEFCVNVLLSLAQMYNEMGDEYGAIKYYAEVKRISDSIFPASSSSSSKKTTKTREDL